MRDFSTTWPDLITHLLVAAYLALSVWSLIYIFSNGWSGLKEAARDFSSFSVRGFSARRAAYLLVVLDVVLTLIHWKARWEADGAIMLAALLLSLGTLALAFFVSKTARGRFLPFALTIVLFLNHSMLCKA